MRIGKVIKCLLACPFVCLGKVLNKKMHPGDALVATICCK